jgi:hypothetical protein
MICRRCGNRVPEYLTTREYFQCPSCGRQFGNPPAEDNRRGYEPRETRYSRNDDMYERRRSRFEPEYDDAPADNRYYDDDQGYYDSGDEYYEDQYYDDSQYDDGYADDGYADDGYADDGYFDDSADYSDDFVDFNPPRRQQPKKQSRPQPKKQSRAPKPKKPKQPARTMKLSVILYVLIVEVIALIIIACISAGINSEQPGEVVPGYQPMEVVETVPEVTADPNATKSPYPVI